MKAKYVLTLEGNEDFLQVKTAKEQILDSVPKGKTTTAQIIGTGLKIHHRRALKYLAELEDEGGFSSVFGCIKFKSGVRCRVRIFKRL